VARILIADDALLVRTVLRRVLADAGHELAAEASSGEEAVALFARHRPDVAILDISMPGMGGLDALRAVLRTSPAARVVMCSVHREERHVIEALSWGARAYVTKPVRAPELLATLASVLAARPSEP